MEAQAMGWKGKGEMSVGRLRNFQKAELSKRPDVQDQGGDDSSRGSLQWTWPEGSGIGHGGGKVNNLASLASQSFNWLPQMTFSPSLYSPTKGIRGGTQHPVAPVLSVIERIQ